MKETTLKTFKDRPDKVSKIWVSHVEGMAIHIEWEAPSDNNSPIRRYHVYLSNKKIRLHDIIPSGEKKSATQEQELRKIGVVEGKDQCYYHIQNLDKDTCYYVVVTAENQTGEGYKAMPMMIRTLGQDVETEALTPYVWGQNNFSQLGLSDEQVLGNVSFYHKFCMKKVLRSELFERESVLQVAPGNLSCVYLFCDKESKTQTVVYTGQTAIAKDENSKKVIFSQKECDDEIDVISSFPFAVNFYQPVAKVVCGNLFAGLLTPTGEVYTWGFNIFGQLGHREPSVGCVLEPTLVEFLEPKENKIIDLACGFNHCLALTENKKVYVWGKRMGLYPAFDFNLSTIEKMETCLLSERNAHKPRLLSSYMQYYKIAKIFASQGNSGVITENGELMLHGMNDKGMLGVGRELGPKLVFFGDFIKRDFFNENKLDVLDLSFGSFHTLVLCRDRETKKNSVFGCCLTENGQLCKVSGLIQWDFVELTDKITGEVVQMSAGSFHSLFVTADKKLYSCGKNTKGQLGFKSADKSIEKPTEVRFTPAPPSDKGFTVELVSAHAGSLYTVALCRTHDVAAAAKKEAGAGATTSKQ